MPINSKTTISMMKNKTLLLICFSITTLISQAQKPIEKGLASITENTLKAQLTFFSSDWFEGREAAEKGAYMAGDYLASLYQQYHLEPGYGNHYFSDVPLIVAHQPKTASIRLQRDGSSKTFEFPEKIRAERITQSYSLEAPIIWGGYGINSDEINEINRKKSSGKILIRLKGLPQITDSLSALAKILQNKKAAEWYKIKNNSLQTANVVAILEYDLNDPYLKKSFEEDPISKAIPLAERELTKRSSGIYKKSLFLPNDKKETPHHFQVSKAVMNELISDFDLKLAQYLQQLSDNKAIPITSFNYKTIALSSEANVEHKTCRNVVAMLKGSTHPDEIIVVGAHYDHLGKYDGYIWNGADDNGSGAIGVVAIAKAFVAAGIQPKRTVVFANWTAEERGLLGSRYFVDTFKDIKKVKYYHNYDMIGRSYSYERPDSAVTLLYTKAWKQAEDLCRAHNTTYKLGLKINYSAWDSPTSGSDNAPFAQKGIPIMWFHTGGHESYHMPSDHVEKIDWQKYEGIVKTSFLTLWNLANE